MTDKKSLEMKVDNMLFGLNLSAMQYDTLYRSIIYQLLLAQRSGLEIAAEIAEAEIETWDKVENFERVKQCQIIAECLRAKSQELEQRGEKA